MSKLIKQEEPVVIWTGRVMLDGRLTIPRNAEGVILILALGGSSHHALVRSVTSYLEGEGFAVLAADLLTPDEQQFDARTGHYRVDLPFLGRRLREIVEWLGQENSTRDLPVAIFATSTAASAAIVAAAGGLQPFAMALAEPRVDLVQNELARMNVPTLLFVDEVPHSERPIVVGRFGEAAVVTIVPGVASLLESDLIAQIVARDSAAWFRQHLVPSPA